jgi:HlyD family secretion protein
MVVVLGLVAAAFYLLRRDGGETRYVTAAATRGPVVRSVSATGTVNPVITVQVGSYVSGPIQALYADFNSPVKAGQLIAKIDPRPFQVKVDEARAAVANAQAQLKKDEADLAYKKLSWERNERLARENVVSQDIADNARSVYQQAVAQVALDKANIQNQQALLQEAEVNLNYTNIISPVDGTVVSRNVDVGQTVAASFQTPTLFLIAKDLTRMQVDTNVSESDIGGVLQGATASFKVDAFPDRTFAGTVGQVRQAPITVQNVVTYDVVVNVPNPELLLKPGMTANVTIVIAKRDNVLRVPVEALRFSPRGAERTATGASGLALVDRGATNREDAAGAGHEPAGGAAVGSAEPVGNAARVWKFDGGRLIPVAIRTGLDDGVNVEVLGGDLRERDSVVVDETGPSVRPKTTTLRFPH